MLVLTSLFSFFPASADDKSSNAAENPTWWDPGWRCRKAVTIDNTRNPSALSGYQVPVNITFDGDMNADFSDLRFVQYNSSSGQSVELPYWVEDRLNSVFASAWVNVGNLPGGTSTTIHVYFGNSQAAGKSNGTTTFDFFDDFDGASLDWNAWDKASAEVADSEITVSGSTLNIQGSGTTMEYIKSKTYMAMPSTAIRTKMRDYLASSYPGEFGYGYRSYLLQGNSILKQAFTSDQFCLLNHAGTSESNAGGILDDDSYHLWDLRWAVDKTELLRDTISQGILLTYVSPGPLFVSLGHPENAAPNTWQGSFDWFLVRKFSDPEPTCTIGQKEYAFSFKSMSFHPQRPSSGDNVMINATFRNPMSTSMTVQASFKYGNDFNQSQPIWDGPVVLAPSADTVVSVDWPTIGGQQTIWVAAFGRSVGSAKIAVNQNPALAPVKDQQLWQDREFLLQLNASDPDGDTLTWSINNSVFNLTPQNNRSAQLSFLPTNDDIGIHRANITVRDPLNRTASMRVNFTVNNVNDPPSLVKIPPLSATQYKELRYQAKATDPDLEWGDVHTFSDNTDLFDIDEKTGVFFFTPAEEHVGKHNVKVTVTDMDGASETSSFTITVANVNDPPTLEFLPPQFALQGRLFQLKIVAADPDVKSDTTEKLRFSDDSALFNINNDTGMVSFTPSNDDLGTFRANITVTDRGGLSSTTLLTITVMNANDPPTMDAIPAQTATEEQPFLYQCIVSDPDIKWGLDNLTFSDDSELFTIDPKTGAISFTPTGGQAGIKRVTITVKDEKGASASASFDITVVHVNHPPFDVVIRFPSDGAKLKEGNQMWLDGIAKDSDKGDTLEYSWSDNGNPAGVGKNISVKLRPGMHTIALEVSDGTETVRSEISIEVTKKESITVAGGGDWALMAGAAVAVVAILAIVGVLAARRKRKPEEQDAMAAAMASSIPEGETVALPPVPPAEAARQEPGTGEKAKKMIISTVDRLSDYQEAHPDEVLDVEPVMETLEIARGLLKSGEDDDALAFAMEAESAVAKLTKEVAPRRVAIKKKK
jgi:hypothetical protein